MVCKLCGNEFQPSKYHANQQVCGSAECQKTRQLQNQKEWRQRNPDYFKCLGQEQAWKEKRRRYNRLWKVTHQDFLKDYDQDHKEQRREYMRGYMRRYRSQSLTEKKVSIIT
ncbi:MAG TPA: hypothetical protein P5110_01000 [Candidatus Omnitrophota bacterium]|nr:hypothetical protein [Candidatus Omnitrophota bacterium]